MPRHPSCALAVRSRQPDAEILACYRLRFSSPPVSMPHVNIFLLGRPRGGSSSLGAAQTLTRSSPHFREHLPSRTFVAAINSASWRPRVPPRPQDCSLRSARSTFRGEGFARNRVTTTHSIAIIRLSKIRPSYPLAEATPHGACGRLIPTHPSGDLRRVPKRAGEDARFSTRGVKARGLAISE
jgi:hypothetical protein